jgi:hypothetical protein
MGAPNAPIRILVAMMVLKEGMGISDEQLYEEGRFNLKTRSALGLMNMDEEIPVESTYYLFRKRIVEWEEGTGKNLLDEAFGAITKEQCLEFGVAGKRLRMDSKLLGSNLAWHTRYEIAHETIQKYWKSRNADANRLTERERELLDEITGEAGRNVSYRSTHELRSCTIKMCGYSAAWESIRIPAFPILLYRLMYYLVARVPRQVASQQLAVHPQPFPRYRELNALLLRDCAKRVVQQILSGRFLVLDYPLAEQVIRRFHRYFLVHVQKTQRAARLQVEPPLVIQLLAPLPKLPVRRRP